MRTRRTLFSGKWSRVLGHGWGRPLTGEVSICLGTPNHMQIMPAALALVDRTRIIG